MIDLHVHTHHSDDSNVTMEEYCIQAIKSGVNYLCFTDHADNNPVDSGCGKFNPLEYFNEFTKIKSKYKDKLIILSGVEFGEPHIYKKELESIQSYHFDYIIGSIHYFYNDMFLSRMVLDDIPIEIVYKNYWLQMERMVEYGGFDAIGHFDFPKRYFNKLIYDESQIESILRKAVKKGIILEINTSSLRKGCIDCMPSNDILDIYYKVGGREVTIGSDSHKIEDLAKDFQKALNLTNDKFQVVYFINRKKLNYIVN
ncbi:MAG: histidinol-phosphatase HisJ family protein [Exilispira sp.]|jgi:histidinol-phosphatase (PHP family)|nr:histidinol-phosphatase HisJ family protein [Exilispira sp.]